MGLTPSAVHKQIEMVEGVLRVPLFTGRNGHLTLTEEGEIFHAEALKSLEHANLAEEKTIARLALKNHLATGKVAIDVSLPGAVHRLFRQSAHAEQLLAKIVEPLLKTRAHSPNLSLTNLPYPNLPVM